MTGWRAFPRSPALPWLLGLAAVLAAALLAGRYAERAALADLRRSASATLALHVAALRTEMQKQGSLPLALASDPEIAAAVGPSPEPALLARVNDRLAEIARASGAAVIYVIRQDGTAVAASNAGEPGSFVGAIYAFRPYFQQALAEGAGRQFALGTVSGRPGLYLSRRVAGPGGQAGVVVVKIEFDGIEAAWRRGSETGGETVMVTDSRGIVLVASEPAWRFGALRPVPDEERRLIRERLEFGDAALAPLPLFPAGEGGGLIRIGSGALPARLALPLDAPIPGTTWRLHTLTRIGVAVGRERVQAQVIAGLAVGLACFGLAEIVGRRRRLRASLAEAAARRTELEERVRERTQALTEANQKLKAEIAERQRAEEERQRLGRELAHAGRLAALGQFAASMAHEINQPLAAIRSYADNAGILIQRGRLPEATENLSAVGRLTERIAGLTRQLKGFARKASGRRDRVALAGVVRASLEVVEVRLSGVALALALPEPSPYVLGEGPRLEQVVVNLVQNALDAVAGVNEPRIAVTVRVMGERAVLEVGDNGGGLPEGGAQVFDAFFTTKANGLGLGLAISRGIVEECGGTLSAGASPEGGALFRVELPLAPAVAAQGAAA
ncbi:sensor histidine kinase [Methylobacterium nonmethylotrophicum]|uniref:C4-dicarboxylate transport sensor protein DctB n=1 Tax=Methylobacterium nonmethylotrophicum TaxID=1141884 RepID=A0A4Z0NF15_9HYPH|nr:ATP-binding protein [Methylobacterium nonmethylotrophicum]TGD93174.1 sensor histidine kinase [Methylobacterium nonmethylotrophicum]